VNAGVKHPGVIGLAESAGLGLVAFQMFFFALFAFAAAAVFGLYARTYPMQDNYRAA
jgi:POT family proton-dependent oligopeptide transporter